MRGRARHGLHGDKLDFIGHSARSVRRTAREAVDVLEYGG